MKDAEGLLLHPSLQKKLRSKAIDIKRIDKLVFRSRGGWKEVGGVLFKDMVRLSDVEEAVREVVSQIQALKQKWVRDYDGYEDEEVPMAAIITLDKVLALLVSPSTPMSSAPTSEIKQ